MFKNFSSLHSLATHFSVVFILLAAEIVLSRCSGGIYKSITTDRDRSANFSIYKTYAWLNDHQPHGPTPYFNEVIENNIKNYVDYELAARNYTPQTDAPDLLFELVLNNQTKISTTTTPVYTAPSYSAYPPNSYRYYNPNYLGFDTWTAIIFLSAPITIVIINGVPG